MESCSQQSAKMMQTSFVRVKLIGKAGNEYELSCDDLLTCLTYVRRHNCGNIYQSRGRYTIVLISCGGDL